MGYVGLNMRVKKVAYFKDYKLKLLFGDNKTKIVDIEPIINKSRGLFYPLKDIEYFKKVFLDDDEYPMSVCWPNGADICPDYLYELGVDAREEKMPVRSLPRRYKRNTVKSVRIIASPMTKKRPKKA